MLSRVARRGPGFCCCHALRLSPSPFARLLLSSPSRCVCYPSPQLLLYVVWGVAIGQGVSAAHRLSIPFRVPPRPSLILVGCRVISCYPLASGVIVGGYVMQFYRSHQRCYCLGHTTVCCVPRQRLCTDNRRIFKLKSPASAYLCDSPSPSAGAHSHPWFHSNSFTPQRICTKRVRRVGLIMASISHWFYFMGQQTLTRQCL